MNTLPQKRFSSCSRIKLSYYVHRKYTGELFDVFIVFSKPSTSFQPFRTILKALCHPFFFFKFIDISICECFERSIALCSRSHLRQYESRRRIIVERTSTKVWN